MILVNCRMQAKEFPSFLEWIVCRFVKSLFWHLKEININLCKFIISQHVSNNLQNYYLFLENAIYAVFTL